MARTVGGHFTGIFDVVGDKPIPTMITIGVDDRGIFSIVFSDDEMRKGKSVSLTPDIGSEDDRDQLASVLDFLAQEIRQTPYDASDG